MPMRLTLSDSFDMCKTIKITIGITSSSTANAQLDFPNDILPIPGTAICVRSKVFLEGPLQ